MIDCFGFYAVSAIFQPCNIVDYLLNDRLWNVQVSLAALTSLLFYETQRNGLLRARWVIILDTGKPDNVPSDGQWAHEGCKLITYFSISPIHVRWFTHGVQFIACMQNLHRLFQYIYYAFTWYLKNLRSNGSDNRSLIMADYFRLMRRRIFPYKMYCVAPSFWAVLGRLRVLSETVRRCDQNNTCASKYG